MNIEYLISGDERMSLFSLYGWIVNQSVIWIRVIKFPKTIHLCIVYIK